MVIKRSRTPLRYPGGKAKALKKIIPFIPLDFSEYREPFLGGGSVFIRLKQEYPNALYKINDLNYDLYCFWKIVKNKADELIREITQIKKTQKDGKKLYQELKSSSEISDDFSRAIRFYILNRITYSGLVDSGGYSLEAFEGRFVETNIVKLKPLSFLLQDVEITNESYENLLFKEGKNVFIYLDPPYWNSRRGNLYGKKGALNTLFNHEQFAKRVKKCKHKWLITYDDSEVIRELFDTTDININSWEMQYGLNTVNGKKAKKGKELFLTNYAKKAC